MVAAFLEGVQICENNHKYFLFIAIFVNFAIVLLLKMSIIVSVEDNTLLLMTTLYHCWQHSIFSSGNSYIICLLYKREKDKAYIAT